MDIIGVIVILIAIGVLLWLIETYIPMDPAIKRIIVAVVIIAVVLWFLHLMGLLPLRGGPTTNDLKVR